MNLITIKEDWPIRVAKHKVLFRKAYPLTEFDNIILSFLYLYNDTIGYNELGSILGFAVEANEEEQVYFDIAEAGIFSSLLDTLTEYHLISTHKNEDGNLIISTTHWGLEARQKGVKYLFYEGVISLNEHYLLFDWESFDNLFHFSKYDLFSEIYNSREIKPYYYTPEDQHENVFLHKALLNFNSELEKNKNIEIQWVNEAVLNYEKSISHLSLSLIKEDEVYRIEVVLNDKPSPELDEIILKEANSKLFADWLLLLRYQLYLKDIKEIHAADISQFTKHVNWQTVLCDSRVVWDNNWFELLSSEEVSSNAVWYHVIQNCPEGILILNIEAYADYWDWSRLSKKVEIPYIINTINQFPWDIDVFLERIDQKELEQLLTTITDVFAIEDWKNVTNRVSFEFIEREIQTLPFDLHTLISFGEIQSGSLILNNPQLSWDWSLISSTYSINYFILNIETLSPYIDTIAVVNRLLKNEADFKLSFNEPKFGSFLIDSLKRTNFKIGKNQDVVLNTETLDFLSNNDLLFWGNQNIPGIEANQNLKWSSERFEKFSNLVKNQAGYDNVSISIDNITIVESNKTFPWNYITLCSRNDLQWSFEFIRKHHDKLALNILINSIPSALVADNLAFFIHWAVDKDMLPIISKHVSNEFTFEQILLNRELLNSHKIAISWVSVLTEESTATLHEIVLLDENELLQLPATEELRNYLSKKCELDFILDNPDLFWDWILVTQERISSELLLDDDFQVEYASYIHWPYLIEKYISPIDLTPTKNLPSLAVLISQSPEPVINESWSVITKKIEPKELWKFIHETIQFDIFTWDWDYISSSKVIPIDHRFLSTYSEKINWNLLSSNTILSSFFQFSKVVYRDTRQWLDRTLEYLYAYKSEWDFKALSSINNITWNERIISEFADKWNWYILSSASTLLTNSNKEKRITEFDSRRLNRFSSLIDWGALSVRYEVTLYPALVSKFINHPWDWEKLSSHPRFELTKEFVLENGTKPWDYHALSSHSFLKVDKELLLQLQDKDWDYNLLSKASWIDNDTLLTLSDKLWNWSLLSSSKNLIFDLNLLSLFVQQTDSNWNAILNSDSLHITPDVVKLLFSNNVLNNDLWVTLSSHRNLDFQQHPDLLLEYKSKWDWITFIKSWKLDFNEITILSTYQDLIDWNLLCESDKFSPSIEILLKFKELLNWKIISGMIVFDINGLRLFKDFLDWEYISQNTSINFTLEMVDEFIMYWDYFYLQENISIPINIREHIIQIVNSIPELQLYLNLKAKQSSWSGYIYHFTHLTNAIEIIKNKKILSRNKAIGFADAAGAVVGRRHTAHEFARFYFRPQTPTQFYNECLGLDITDKYYESALRLGLPKCPIPVFFRFNLQEVLLKLRDKCYMSNGNMQTNWAVVKPVLQMLSKFNFSDVYSTIRNTSDGDFRTYINYSQQEFLIKDEFDFTSFINFDIIVRSENDKDELIRRIGERTQYVNRVKVSSYSDDIYHNQNKDIECEYRDGILNISSDYSGNGYKSGMFIVQFPSGTKYEMISGNVINATESMICAYPSLNIKFENHTSLIVYFQDEIKNTKWELYSFSASNYIENIQEPITISKSIKNQEKEFIRPEGYNVISAVNVFWGNLSLQWKKILFVSYKLSKLNKLTRISFFCDEDLGLELSYAYYFKRYDISSLDIEILEKEILDEISNLSSEDLLGILELKELYLQSLEDLSPIVSLNKVCVIHLDGVFVDSYDILKNIPLELIIQVYPLTNEQLQLFSFKNPNVVVNEISCESIYNYFYDEWGSLFRIGFAEKDGYDPVLVLNKLSKNPKLSSLYSKRVRHYTLYEHTLLVCLQFEKHFKQSFDNRIMDTNLFRVMLALHDIGKGKAHEEGNKNNQYDHTRNIIIDLWSELPFNAEELELIIALISSDAIGEYFQEKSSIFETKKRILQSMGNLRIEPRYYFKLMMTYYQCDTAAYTADAGGLKYLEFLFEYQGCEKVFDEKEGLFKMTPKYWGKYLELKKVIEE